MRIGFFILYFTGLRVSHPLILTVRQIEELTQSEDGTELLIHKQGRGQQKKLQTITLREDARNLLIYLLYDDLTTILRDKGNNLERQRQTGCSFL
jgi:hypothetical protein